MHSHIFLYRAKYYRIMANSSQKSHLNRKIYVFRLITVIWMFPCSALLLCKAKNVLCFLHEWGLHPSYATDNGGKNGGNVGGTMVMSPVCPQSCHKTKKRMQVLMQKMQPPVQRLQPWMKRLQIWRTMDEIA